MAGSPPALRSASFRRLWGATAVSSVGTQLSVTGSAWVVYHLTGSTTSIGMVGLAFSLPITVVPLVAGAIVDRTDPRRLLIVLLAAEAATAVALAVAAITGAVSIGWFCAAAVLDACRLSFAIPAQVRLGPATVPPSALRSAQSLSAIVWPGSALIGPALAGVFLSSGRPWLIFAVNAVLTGISAVLMSRVVATPPTPTSNREQFSAGLRFAFIVRWPIAVIATITAASTVTIGVESLMPAIASISLHSGVIGYTALRVGAGVSALIAGVVVSWLAAIRTSSGVAAGVLVAFGSALFGTIVLTRLLALATVVVAVAAAACTVGQILLTTVLLERTPRRHHGSVGGIAAASQNGIAGLAAAGIGVAAGTLPLSLVVMTASAGAALIAAAWAAWAASAIGRRDREGDARRARPPHP